LTKNSLIKQFHMLRVLMRIISFIIVNCNFGLSKKR